ncbi:MAG TPA: Ig-like domain-containing protein, partial [Jatrophihabitans sp.]|nr:Ig-like domain-containing protein [Jatrophihabitans sp.]
MVAVAPPAAANGGNASLQLTKTVTGASVAPTLAATLAVDKSTAIPGDALTYTARVTNTGAVMTLTGAYSAVEVPDNPGTLADWYDEVEYHDVASKTWVSLGGYQATQSGWTPVAPSPATTGLSVTTTPVPASDVTYPSDGDHVLGTALGGGATASWAYTAELTLSAAQVAVLADPKRSSGIRNVVHVEVTPRDPQVGQPYVYRADFTDPIPAGGNPVTGVSVAFTLPDGSSRTVDQSSVPGLASIPVGGSVDVPAKYIVPTVAPPGVSEADAAYLSRLAAVEGTTLTASAKATGTGAGSPVSASADPVSTTEHLPIVSVGKTGPASIDAGDAGTYRLPVQNTGGAAAGQIALTDSVPAGGTAPVTGAPDSLAPGGSATATAAFPVPADQPDGPLTDTAQVRWADANGNPYGPVSASFTTTVQSSLVGSTLTLSPASAGPDVVGTDQVLTATLVDRNGQPMPNIAVTLDVRGTNVVTGTVNTNSAGVATFHYTGTAAGQDTAQAKAVAGTTQVESNTAQIGWVTATGPIAPVGTTTVDGRFFPEPTNATTFVAKPGDTPAFAQSFPSLAFDPPSGALPHDITGVTPATRPFTDVTLDLLGNGLGALPAQGNGRQAGVGDMTCFDAAFTAQLVVAQASDVTLRFQYGTGFLFGVGGGAIRVGGLYENIAHGRLSAFDAYQVVGGDNTMSSSVRNGTVTVHFPAAGSYPYEVDYTGCGSQLSLVMQTASFTADESPLSVYAGYADIVGSGGNSTFPYPWQGSPGVTFIGNNVTADGAAIRFDNTSDTPITLDKVTVDIGTYHVGDIWHPYAPNGEVVVPAHGTLILAQTYGENFDISEVVCGPSGPLPQIHVTIAGETTTYTDADRAMTVNGCFWNESHPWDRIGGSATGVDHPLPPAGSVMLSPLAGGTAKVTSVQAAAGSQQSFRVDVLDASGLPVGNAPVDLAITGAHPGYVAGTTDVDGTAELSYIASSAGDDSVQAVTFISGQRAVSGAVSVHWSLPAGTVPDPNNPGQNLAAAAPTISILSPADGSRVTAPTPVRATITPPDGETVTSWTLSYQAVSPGSPAVTLAHGDGAPPDTLATFDPTVLPNDSYTLTVTANSSNGGLQTATSTVNVDGKLKLGRYVTTYTDANQSVNGLPMQVLRSYDSTDPRLGDFGVGWQVSVGNFRVSANRTLGAGGWTEYPAQCSLFGCQYAFKSSVKHTVTVTFPDQHEEKFDFTPSGGFSAFYFLGSAAFTAESGTTSTLEAVDSGIAYDFAGNIRSDISGPLYSPTRYKLTTKDGKVYLLDTSSGLVSETDPNGNSITVDGSGVHGSNGQSIT